MKKKINHLNYITHEVILYVEFTKDRTVLLLLTSSSSGLKAVLGREPVWSLEGQILEELPSERAAGESPSSLGCLPIL